MYMYVGVKYMGEGSTPGAYFAPGGRVCIYLNHTPPITKGLSYTGEQRKKAITLTVNQTRITYCIIRL